MVVTILGFLLTDWSSKVELVASVMCKDIIVIMTIMKSVLHPNYLGTDLQIYKSDIIKYIVFSSPPRLL